ncbi:MAG: ribonuclease P protein component [Bacteroidaceae bacterium]|nr:ribonuclease P protein component [Bacteroidaceae bacterium]
MPASELLTLSKEERISSKRLVERLFGGGKSHSMAVFPIRLVYMKYSRESDEAPEASILISVPKRCFKSAVKRNRVKRQIREAYRHHKCLLKLPTDQCAALAFIWTDNQLHGSEKVERSVVRLLKRMNEKL